MDDNDLPLNDRIDLIDRNDPSITNFELEYIEQRTVTEDQIRALFRGMLQNTHVRKLDLCGTPQELRPTVSQELLPPVLGENSSIEYLQFPVKMTNAEFLPSVDALCNNNNMTIETLSLHFCDIRGRDGGEMIGRLIWNNHHITTIDLEWNTHLGPAGASQIAAALGDENCSLKILDLGGCGIGDEGVDALCTALQVNNSLGTFRFYNNIITDEGYRALGRSLPCMSGLKEIHFSWDQGEVSGAVLRQMMDGLRKNQSLQCIYTMRDHNFSEELRQEWNTCCTFVGSRNKMKCHFDKVRHRMDVAAREGIVRPTPVRLSHLLQWCHHQEYAEVQDSLRFLVLCSNANEILGLTDDIVAEENGQEEKAIDATATRTEETEVWQKENPVADATTMQTEEDGQKEKVMADATATRTEEMHSDTAWAGGFHKWICFLCCWKGRE